MTTFAPELVKLVQAEKRRQNRRKAYGRFAQALITSALVTLSHGWLFMLAVGIAHGEWVPALPTIGYGWALVLVALLRGVFSPIKRSKDES
jgi:formate/nitrite transporter FocA (FNT family)